MEASTTEDFLSVDKFVLAKFCMSVFCFTREIIKRKEIIIFINSLKKIYFEEEFEDFETV